MSAVTPALIALKTLSLAMGGLITYFAYRAYRRTGSPALRALAVGFAIVTVGAILAGFFDQVLPFERQYALMVESVMTTAGFGVILYSLYVE